MRNLFLLAGIFVMCSACEDVITVDTPTEPPRLSIDALIRIDESRPATTVTVRSGLTSSFFGSVEEAELDLITITNLDRAADQNVLVLNESGSGVYSGTTETEFFTTGRLVLDIEFRDQVYRSETTYTPSVPIESIRQGDGTLFSGDETEILLSFIDAANRTDFYLFDFSFDEYLVSEDTFYQGQLFQFSYFYEDGLSPGQEVEIGLIGIDENFYNYMTQLIVQAGGDQGPFQTPAATVRGNIINVTNSVDANSVSNIEDSNNFALGYFSVSQEFRSSIIIE